MLKTSELFALERVPDELRGLLEVDHPWESLERLDHFVNSVEDARYGDVHPSAVLKGSVYLADGATVAPHAYIEGPAWIGQGATIGQGAYLRGGVVIAPQGKVGHATEVKRALFLTGASAPHFNYVGDSLLGSGVNLGAGVKLANFRAIPGTIRVADRDTGLRKFGAALGDDVMLGCNCVTAPGTVIGARSVAYHGAMLRGVYPADTVIKVRQSVDMVRRH